MSVEVGTELGPYRVTRKLGAGGMGEVYACTDTRLGRTVAVKVLPRDMAGDAEALRRFQQEANTVASLNHPNIVQIYDVGSAEEGSPFLVMELLEGDSLRARMEGKAMPFKKVAEISAQLARALGAAHARGIVHRDLKPENVYLTKPGPAKVLDFGLAKLAHRDGPVVESGATTQALFTRPGMVMGTVGYMAPEQIEGREADGRADIFALGVMMWEMLSGRRPFHRDSSIDTLHAILREDPPEVDPGLGLPAAMERILRRCLEKEPEDRFQSANDLAFQLETLSQTSGSASTARMSAILAAEEEGRAPWFRTPHRLFYPLPIKLPRRLQVCFWDRVQLSAAYLILAAVLVGAIGALTGVLPIGLLDRRELGKSFAPALDVTGNIQSAGVSGNGQHFLLSLVDEGGKTRLVYQRSGQSAMTLEHASGEEILALTNTGSALLRSAAGDVFVQEMNENAYATKIATRALEADVTPDGSKVALLRRSADKYVIEYPQGSVIHSTQQRLRNLRVSPAGDALAFFEREPSTGLALLRVWRRGQLETWKGGDGLAPKGAFPSWAIQGMAWDQEGRGLFIASKNLLAHLSSRGERILHRNAGNLRVCGATREGPLLLVGTELIVERGRLAGSRGESDLRWIGGTLAALSGDGTRVLVARDEELWILPSDRSRGRRIGTGTVEALSADGKTVLFTNNERTLAMPSEGGDSVLLATRPELGGLGFVFSGGSGDPRFALSEDGRWVLVMQKQLLARRPMDGSGAFERLELPLEGLGEGWRIDAAFTVDGQRIALQVRESGERRTGIVVDTVARKQGYRAPLEDSERIMAWRRDGSFLTFSSGKGAAEFRVLDPGTGQRRTLTKAEPPFPNTAARFRDVRCSSDGSFYAYRYATTGLSQLMIAKGF